MRSYTLDMRLDHCFADFRNGPIADSTRGHSPPSRRRRTSSDKFTPALAMLSPSRAYHLCRLFALGSIQDQKDETISEGPPRTWRNPFWRGQSNQFLEARIFAQWVEHWIQSEQRRSEWRVRCQSRLVWNWK